MVSIEAGVARAPERDRTAHHRPRTALAARTARGASRGGLKLQPNAKMNVAMKQITAGMPSRAASALVRGEAGRQGFELARGEERPSRLAMLAESKKTPIALKGTRKTMRVRSEPLSFGNRTLRDGSVGSMKAWMGLPGG